MRGTPIWGEAIAGQSAERHARAAVALRRALVVLGVALGIAGLGAVPTGAQAVGLRAGSSGWGITLARTPVPGESTAGGLTAGAADTIERSRLPREANDTLALIAAGGPYPYAKDGVVFGNFERVLPRQPRGYYHEYTVPTPRVRNRGARRIVCGGPLKRTDNCFYSDDHYTSFKRIVE